MQEIQLNEALLSVKRFRKQSKTHFYYGQLRQASFIILAFVDERNFTCFRTKLVKTDYYETSTNHH